MNQKTPGKIRIGHFPLFTHALPLLPILTFMAAMVVSLSCGSLPPMEEHPTPPTQAQIAATPTEETRGTILWARPLLIPPRAPSAVAYLGQPRDAFFVHEDAVFFADPGGYPAALDLNTGNPLWQWEDKGIVYGVEPQTVYIVRSDQRLYALDTRTGQIKWKTIFGLSDNVQADWPLWIGKQTLYLPFRDLGFCLGCPYLVSIDKNTGQILWWDSNGLEYEYSESTVIVTLGGGHIRGLHPITGNAKWDLQLAHGYGERHFILENRLYCKLQGVAGGAPGPIAAIDLDSGKSIWEVGKDYQQRGEYYTDIVAVSPALVYAIYATGYHEEAPWHLSVLDRQTGEELWTWPDFAHIWAGSRERPGYHFVGELEGTTIISHRNLGYTYRVEFRSGSVLWKNDDLVLNHLVGVSRNTLIALGGSSPDSPFLFGLDPATGERRWRLELVQLTAQPIILQDRIIYGSGQSLVVLDPETGTFMLTIPLPDRPGRLIAQGDFIVVQTGSPGSVGTLSVVRP